ncbi:hypothetical protein Tco_1123335 [Tanacetum coccineum]|uniref:Reverse transcriptase zinc-binding domain-containing protein n=1 Tax=Tanacetum coccineum TaxID=301880 RepID=A0ABQ5J4Q6_9ASTR
MGTMVVCEMGAIRWYIVEGLGVVLSKWCWDWVANPRGRSLGELEDCISLVRDQVPIRDGTDSWQWMLEDGGFTVKVLKEIVGEKIPVRTLIDNIGMDFHSTLCPHCEEAIETIDHSMVRCKIVSLVWSSICAWWNIGSFVGSSVQDVLNLAGFGSSKITFVLGSGDLDFALSHMESSK